MGRRRLAFRRKVVLRQHRGGAGRGEGPGVGRVSPLPLHARGRRKGRGVGARRIRVRARSVRLALRRRRVEDERPREGLHRRVHPACGLVRGRVDAPRRRRARGRGARARDTLLAPLQGRGEEEAPPHPLRTRLLRRSGRGVVLARRQPPSGRRMAHGPRPRRGRKGVRALRGGCAAPRAFALRRLGVRALGRDRARQQDAHRARQGASRPREAPVARDRRSGRQKRAHPVRTLRAPLPLPHARARPGGMEGRRVRARRGAREPHLVRVRQRTLLRVVRRGGVGLPRRRDVRGAPRRGQRDSLRLQGRVLRLCAGEAGRGHPPQVQPPLGLHLEPGLHLEVRLPDGRHRLDWPLQRGQARRLALGGLCRRRVRDPVRRRAQADGRGYGEGSGRRPRQGVRRGPWRGFAPGEGGDARRGRRGCRARGAVGRRGAVEPGEPEALRVPREGRVQRSGGRRVRRVRLPPVEGAGYARAAQRRAVADARDD